MEFVQTLLLPIDSLYYFWKNWRIDNIIKLEHSGQICYLRKILNDEFDPIEKRIRVESGNLYETTYIYTAGEEKEVSLYTETENNPIWLRADSETADSGLDFIVWVPVGVYDASYFKLLSLINFYKAGGKRYNIIINE
ncbi:hypothetical protein [Flavobacterium panacagri]|uniref:hypothetical protein n=1 Tax=Flavobacterium panacagri TaxID=3034146 RepID=UPI0025A4DB15|nr:hypothetical protein [Flavobacterium panacagri]